MSSPLLQLRRAAGRLLSTSKAQARADRRHRQALLDSGLFDEAWYRSQPGVDLLPKDDAVEHYVRTGRKTAASPHPCFSVEWYRSQRGVSKEITVAPFVHYVLTGARAKISPHPFFDSKWYVTHVPESESWPGGPLKHYLDRGWREGARPSEAFPVSAASSATEGGEAPLLAWIHATEPRIALSRNWEDLPRTSASFDRLAAGAVLAQTHETYVEIGGPTPLVSIIIPTKDRADSLMVSIQSVLDQSYSSWELIVVDDGGTDDTVERIRSTFTDPRVRVLVSPENVGVSKARNLGLREIRGDYVAYLDSDNTWTPQFLEVMVENVTVHSARFAYAISELVEEVDGGRHMFRAMEFNREALLERNFIDCIVVLHERSLLDEVGLFDEGLRRNVDWDLFIRMSGRTDFRFVPFVATTYDAWETRADRITVNEKFGYRFVIQEKHLVSWTPPLEEPADRPEVSVVLTAARSATAATKAVERLLETLPESAELIVVDSRLSEADARLLLLLEMRDPRVMVLRQRQALSTELARNIGAAAASGEILVFAGDELGMEGAWLENLIRPLEDADVVAVQPKILDAPGTVWSAGVVIGDRGYPYQLLQGVPGDASEVERSQDRQGLSSRCIAVRRSDFIAVDGFDCLYVNDADGADLSLRLSRSKGQQARLVYASSVAVWFLAPSSPPVKASQVARANENGRLFLERWAGVAEVTGPSTWREMGYHHFGYAPTRSAVERSFSPLLHRVRTPGVLRWAIKIGPPTVDRRKNWGDWHFANALKASIERLGHEAVVDCKDAWYRDSSADDDVVLVLRGVSKYQVNPQHLNLLWIISHPDRVDNNEMRDYDRVFVASASLAQRYSERLGTEVSPLLQCSDSTVFKPVETELSDRHEVLFVGNARGVRPSVATALEAGIVPSVYGLRWEGLLPAGALRDTYVPNDSLPALYGGAGVVLNDHWEDMARDGLLSNRLFDLAACGARIVSDQATGLEDVFGDVVLTYSTPEELARAVGVHRSETPDRRAARLALSETVRRDHSFDARAAELVAAAEAFYAVK